MADPLPTPTATRQTIDGELERWSRVYAGEHYHYGEEPGPIARRAVRYHRVFLPRGGTALDAGCGEGQDLVFLAERGYVATGVEFTAEGARKARGFLGYRGLPGEVLEQDLRDLDPSLQYDLVIAVNSVQFMGAEASACLDRLTQAVAPGGVLAVSLFGREPGAPEVAGTLWFTTLAEVLARLDQAPDPWQSIEAANLWQWNLATNEPEPFVTLIARKAPPARRTLLSLVR